MKRLELIVDRIKQTGVNLVKRLCNNYKLLTATLILSSLPFLSGCNGLFKDRYLEEFIIPTEIRPQTNNHIQRYNPKKRKSIIYGLRRLIPEIKETQESLEFLKDQWQCGSIKDPKNKEIYRHSLLQRVSEGIITLVSNSCFTEDKITIEYKHDYKAEFEIKRNPTTLTLNLIEDSNCFGSIEITNNHTDWLLQNQEVIKETYQSIKDLTKRIQTCCTETQKTYKITEKELDYHKTELSELVDHASKESSYLIFNKNKDPQIVRDNITDSLIGILSKPKIREYFTVIGNNSDIEVEYNFDRTFKSLTYHQETDMVNNTIKINHKGEIKYQAKAPKQGLDLIRYNNYFLPQLFHKMTTTVNKTALYFLHH